MMENNFANMMFHQQTFLMLQHTTDLCIFYLSIYYYLFIIVFFFFFALGMKG